MSSELIRRPLPHPARSGARVAFFADADRALRHLGNHVLTSPECEAWAVVVPALLEHLDLTSVAERERFFQQACAQPGPAAQAVLGLYRDAAEEAVTHAFFLGWHVTEGNTTVSLGTTGVLVIIAGPAVITVYIPGEGSAEAVRNDYSRAVGQLNRERGRMRRACLPSDGETPSAPGAPTSEEDLYRRVFLPVVRFLLGRYHRAHTLDGQTRSQGPLVARALPTLSNLTLLNWQEYRTRVGAGGKS